MKTGFEGDFDTGNVKYKARERYSFGFSDPRGIFGSPALPKTRLPADKGPLGGPFLFRVMV
jgi:hypothetical protein